MDETFSTGARSELGRETRRDVLLLTRLEEAIQRLNPDLESRPDYPERRAMAPPRFLPPA